MAAKKQKTKVESDEDFYFVSIKRPLELRRQILECSRKTIYSLQDYQRLVLFRERKLKEIKKLDSLMKELLFLNKKLNDKLPRHKDFSSMMKKHENVPLKQERKIISPRQANEHIALKMPLPKPVLKKSFNEKSELERLEDSLSSIEKKLKGLQ